MSDKFELERHIKSLTPAPDKEAKREAKALFLQTAEEAAEAWAEKAQENTAEPKRKGLLFRIRKSRKTWFNFAAGMAATLILAIGILTAYDPAYLSGSVGGGDEMIHYRMFPAGTETLALDTAQKAAGELSLFHLPGEGEEIHGQFTKIDRPAPTGGFAYYTTGENKVTNGGLLYVPVNRSNYKVEYGNSVCYGELVLLKATNLTLKRGGYIPCNGQTLSAADYPVLAGILAPGAEKFTLPDLSEQSPVEGALWCIASRGDYPYIKK